MLLGELYSRQTKPYRQSGNARLYVGSCFDSGSQHIEAPVEASNIYEIIPRNYANLAFCAGFQLNCMIYVNFDRRGRTCARLHLSLLAQRSDLGVGRNRLLTEVAPQCLFCLRDSTCLSSTLKAISVVSINNDVSGLILYCFLTLFIETPVEICLDRCTLHS